MQKTYDVVIVGGGPSGLSAGIYSALAGHSTLILEKYMYGGQITLSQEVKNYPSLKNIDGTTLAMQMIEQAKECGVEMRYEEVIGYKNLDKKTKLVLTNKGEIKAKTIILAMGAKARKLGVETEEQFIGRGVGYCATCDGALYKGKTMAVVGGGNTAFEDVLYLSNLTDKVYLVHYKDTFKCNADLLNRVKELVKQKKVEILTNYKVKSLIGEKVLTSVVLENVNSGENKKLDISALFIAVGREPESVSIENFVKLNNYGYIETDEDMKTSVKGVFACGDIRDKMLRQVVTACSDGAIAATSAHKYITETK